MDASCVVLVLSILCLSPQFLVPLSSFCFTRQWTFCILRAVMQNGTWCSTHGATDVKLYALTPLPRWKTTLERNSVSKCHFRVETPGATFRNILKPKAASAPLQPALSMLFLFILLSLSGSSQSHVSLSFLFPSVLFNKFIYLPDLFIPLQQFCYSVDSSFKLCVLQGAEEKNHKKTEPPRAERRAEVLTM